MNNVGNEIVINDKKIEEIEQILLNNGRFDDERRNIIRNFNESFDVNACPGSGKTTVLLAKLTLLLDQMPFKDGKGVCILTHTNVAVDEIKERLGSKAEILFKYPNYIGTIQSFINKYLTTPFFKSHYNKDIQIEEDEEYKLKLELMLRENGYKLNSSNTWINDREFVAGTKKLMSKAISLENGEITISINSIKTKQSYRNIINIMQSLIKEGLLTYRDSYYLANIYLDINKEMDNIFNERFKFVFIDEMQDTNIYQNNILSRIFDNEKVILQRFGDINQSIFSGGQEDEQCGWHLDDNVKELNSSNRYGNNIANILNYIKCIGEGNIVGNDNIESVEPHIIVFDDDCIDDVKGKFRELIEEYNISNYKSAKAIGRIGKGYKCDHITIKNYFESYNKKQPSEKYNCYNELIYKLEKGNTVGEFFEDIMKVIGRCIRTFKKNCSDKEIKKELVENYNSKYIDFKISFINIYNDKKVNDNLDIEKIKSLIEDFILDVYGNEEIQYLNEYFNIVDKGKYICPEIALTEDNNVLMNLNTIHGVKGETHSATLYLQTKYGFNKDGYYKDISDIDNIIDFMCGDKDIKRESMSNELKETLNTAYVAMSRPTHLLCIAVHINTIKGKIEKLESIGYKVVGCNDKVNNMIKVIV